MGPIKKREAVDDPAEKQPAQRVKQAEEDECEDADDQGAVGGESSAASPEKPPEFPNPSLAVQDTARQADVLEKTKQQSFKQKVLKSFPDKPNLERELEDCTLNQLADIAFSCANELIGRGLEGQY